MLDIAILVGFFVLILGSGVIATNFYCRLAYDWCNACSTMNAKRRRECRKCGTRLR